MSNFSQLLCKLNDLATIENDSSCLFTSLCFLITLHISIINLEYFGFVVQSLLLFALSALFFFLIIFK